ncbi:response regulator transcription factor, partial [Anaerosporobacter sp.]|uniref:response regulator transcription factor n=1 Tax=Anaerosporobacter sp. TaxID=1872529 RepID=UPI00286F4EF5
DDLEINSLLKGFLESEGYQVTSVFDGESALKSFHENQYDLILLDLMIPKIDGISVMKSIRNSSVIPIIIISAKDSDSDKTIGLGLGADDYITKPFSITEVLARIKAQLRRTTTYTKNDSHSKADILSVNDITINTDDYTVFKKNKKIELTNKEFQILKLLVENPKKVYTKAQIYSSIWNDDFIADENAVNVHISRIRTKIEDDPKSPQYILTVWGIGYKLGNFS